MKLFHTRHEGEKEGQPPSHVVTERTQGHSLHQMQRSCMGMCVTVNWYPSALSIFLDSEEGERRVQWTGMKCRVRCGTCGVLLGVGSHVRHGKVSINCYIS